MQHPDPAKIRYAMTLLSEYEEGRRTVLDMTLTCARKSPECGTVACFAGHFHIADMRRRKKRVRWHTAYFPGRNAFEQYVYPHSRYTLNEWAVRNPDLWGNPYGVEWACDGAAYGLRGNPYRSDRSITLRTVINHWIKVAERIENAQAS